MSLIFRLRRHLPIGFCPEPVIFQSIESKYLHSNWLYRKYAQAALKEEEEVEEIEIDPRKLPADYDPEKFDPTSHRCPPTERVFRLVDEVASLTLMEAAELSSILLKKMGIEETPTIGVMRPGAMAGLAQMSAKGPGADAKEENKEEKTVFELKLVSFDAAGKLKVIKEIRGCTDLGLKEAKDLVEKAPAVFKTGLSKEDAEKILEKMTAAGAKVVME